MIPSSLAQAVAWMGTGGSQQLTWALLHVLWQGCVVAVLYALAARAMRRAPSNARYLAGVAALFLMAACLPATLWLLPGAALPHSAMGVGKPSAAVATQMISPMVEPTVVAAEPMSQKSIIARATDQTVTTSTSIPAGEPIWQPMAGRAATRLTWLLERVSPYASVLFLCGVAVMLLRVSLGLHGGRRLRRSCTPMSDGAIFAMVREHTHRLGMRIMPMVACTDGFPCRSWWASCGR